jgi:hypothetical protein
MALDRGAYVDSSLVSVPTTLLVAAVYAVRLSQMSPWGLGRELLSRLGAYLWWSDPHLQYGISIPDLNGLGPTSNPNCYPRAGRNPHLQLCLS